MISRRFDRLTIRQTVLSSLLATVMAGAFYAPAFAQSGDVNSRLTRIENEIQTLSRALFKGETPPAGAFAAPVDPSVQANIQLRLTQIEVDVRALTGRLEEQSYEINRLRAQVDQLYNAQSAPAAAQSVTGQGSDAYMTQVQQPQTQAAPTGNAGGFILEDSNAAAPSDAPTTGQLGTAITTLSGQAITAGTPAALYEESFAAIRGRDFIRAREGFERFLKDYPEHTLAANSKYWLGETYYVKEDYESAARIFAEGFQKYPTGSKGPDNLLKMGLSLAALGKTKEACIALSQLRKQYPSGAVPVLTQGDQEMVKLKCTQ